MTLKKLSKKVKRHKAQDQVAKVAFKHMHTFLFSNVIHYALLSYDDYALSFYTLEFSKEVCLKWTHFG